MKDVMASRARSVEFKAVGLVSAFDVGALEEPYRSILSKAVKFASI